jgi:hypothetical protein
MENRRQDGQWILLGIIWAAGLAAGLIGFNHHAVLHGYGLSPWDDIYMTLQLVSLNSGALVDPVPLELEIARFLLPMLAGATALKAFWGLIRERYLNGQLARLSGHIIICGLSRKGFLLAMAYHNQGKQVVVIERDEENDWLQACRESHMYILLGDAAEPVLLTRAGVSRADMLLAVVDEDGINANIALQAKSLMDQTASGFLRCLVQIDDPRLYGLLKGQSQSLENTNFQLVLFNVYERGAIRMLQEYPAWFTPTARPPHIVLVGLGHLGQNLLIHLGRSWWNLRPNRAWKMQMTVIDQDARQIIKTLVVRHPQLADAVLFNPIPLNIHSAEFEDGGYFNDKQPDKIYICLDSDTLVLEAALILQQVTQDKTPLVLRMAESKGLAQLLGQPAQNLHSFILLERICTPDALQLLPRDDLARAVHEAYLHHLLSGPFTPEDPTARPWEELALNFREECQQFVDHLLGLLFEFGYSISSLTDWNAPSYAFPEELTAQMASRISELEKSPERPWHWPYAWKALFEQIVPGSDPSAGIQYIQGIPAFFSTAGYQLKPAEPNKP